VHGPCAERNHCIVGNSGSEQDISADSVSVSVSVSVKYVMKIIQMSTSLGTDINYTKECAIWISVDI
jgi:hypothetical protein